MALQPCHREEPRGARRRGDLAGIGDAAGGAGRLGREPFSTVVRAAEEA